MQGKKDVSNKRPSGQGASIRGGRLLNFCEFKGASIRGGRLKEGGRLIEAR